ncbi:MAG: Gfo/Idh/MocA family oxidoreductase [Phycisphaerales bacterium]|nr:Gfo/Idh/MocA family oxidoreductase [Phycisphaerales bacterium]
MTQRQTRREFLGVAAAGTVGSALAGTSASARSASTRVVQDQAPTGGKPPIRIATIGLRGQGNSLARSFAGQPGAQLVALCDVDAQVLAQRQAEFAERGVETRTHQDPREVFAADDIDAVVIATPNHTHALLAVWALEAGKHVYVEKPVSQVVKEGRAIVDAADRTGLVCQTGTHGRSSNAVRSAVQFVHDGGIGRVTCSRGLCYKPRRSIGQVKGPQFAPSSVDYDRWLGPVAYQALDRRNLHYDWHWSDHTGNGDLGNQGIHQMDIARWALNAQSLPRRVYSIGGRLGYDDDGNTPNTQVVLLEYEDAPLVFEVRGLPQNKAEQSAKWKMDKYMGHSIGNLVHGEKGTVRISNSYGHADAVDLDGNQIASWKGGGDHRRNFVDAVRANDPSMLNAPIIDGHLSSACCHVGLVSHQLGTPMNASGVDRSVAGNAELADAWSRMRSHLEANGVDLDATPATMGRELVIDVKRESPVRNPEAGAMFTRTCREPFTFPNGLPA